MVSKTIFVQTYGCTSNKADSQIMRGLLQKAGYEITSNEYEANYLLINSCGVKSSTEEKIIHRLKELSKLNKKIIVAGCLTKINPDRIKKVVPNFSAMIDPRSVHKIVDIIKQIENGDEKIIQVSEKPIEKPMLPRCPFSKVIDIIKISEGCLSRCAFCATKLARGNLYSYRPKTIRDAIKLGLEERYKEFYLTSEDNSCYGFDQGINLAKLLNAICEIKGKFFVRVGMANPLHVKKFLDELIEAYRNDKIFKFLHLPVQSGSDRILELMRRGYGVKDFIKIVEKFREEFPQVTLATDIIAGFPGEDSSDFEETLQLIKKVKPDIVNISKFGARTRTEAAKLKQLDVKIVNERSRILSELVKKITFEVNKRWIGWKGEILVDEKGKNNSFVGRNFAYKPIVVESKKNLLGKFLEVKVVDARSNYLLGELDLNIRSTY